MKSGCFPLPWKSAWGKVPAQPKEAGRPNVPKSAAVPSSPTCPKPSQSWSSASRANELWPTGPAPKGIILESSVKVQPEDCRSLCLFPSASAQAAKPYWEYNEK